MNMKVNNTEEFCVDNVFTSTSKPDPERLEMLSIAITHNALHLKHSEIEKIILYLVKVIHDADESAINLAYPILIEFSSLEDTCPILFNILKECKTSDKGKYNLILLLLKHMFDNAKKHTCLASNLMLNLSLQHEELYNLIADIKTVVVLIVRKIEIHFEDWNYKHFAGILANMSRVEEIRRVLTDRESMLLGNLVPLLVSSPFQRLRHDIVRLLRNLCFDMMNHSWFVEPHIDMVTHLLYLLAGGEQLSDEEYETLPPLLQYLPEDKVREENSEIRQLVLETLYQLASTKDVREYMRKHNMYAILREYHKWETNEQCLDICEYVVNLLIRTEDEIGADNLHSIKIPTNIQEKFEKTVEESSF